MATAKLISNVSQIGVFLLVLAALTAWAKDDSSKWTVSWNAPFLASQSGYGSEATSFILGLNSTLSNWDISVGLAHGDSIDWDLIPTISPPIIEFLDAAAQRQFSLKPETTIVVCHSEPGAWSVPTPLYESASPCPPVEAKWHAVIGRTMFETDRLPDGWQTRLDAMTEIWVPTAHHQRIFQDAKVTKPVVVVGQGVDSTLWDPDRVEPLEWDDIINYDDGKYCRKDDYKFLSVFKWEDRKGHDVLIKSFWRAFYRTSEKTKPNGGACLIIVTSLYHDDGYRVMQDIADYWTNATGRENSKNKHRRGIVLLSRLPTEELIRLYKTVDAFVLPSRGEGWGRPYMEAMSMGLPVIATNWSGPTDFVTSENGYLLPIAGLVDAKLDAFPGHKWANPDEHALQELMVHLVLNPQEGRQKGARARQDVLDRWSNRAMAKVVVRELERVARVGAGEESERGGEFRDDNGEL